MLGCLQEQLQQSSRLGWCGSTPCCGGGAYVAETASCLPNLTSCSFWDAQLGNASQPPSLFREPRDWQRGDLCHFQPWLCLLHPFTLCLSTTLNNWLYSVPRPHGMRENDRKSLVLQSWHRSDPCKRTPGQRHQHETSHDWEIVFHHVKPLTFGVICYCSEFTLTHTYCKYRLPLGVCMSSPTWQNQFCCLSKSPKLFAWRILRSQNSEKEMWTACDQSMFSIPWVYRSGSVQFSCDHRDERPHGMRRVVTPIRCATHRTPY